MGLIDVEQNGWLESYGLKHWQRGNCIFDSLVLDYPGPDSLFSPVVVEWFLSSQSLKIKHILGFIAVNRHNDHSNYFFFLARLSFIHLFL